MPPSIYANSSNGSCIVIVLVTNISVNGVGLTPKLGEDIHGFHEVGSDFVDLHRA